MLNGTEVTVVNNTYTFIIEEHVIVTVSFKNKEVVEPNKFNLTLGDNLTVNINHLTDIEKNTSVIITVTVPEGKEVDEFKINGIVKTLTNNEFELIMTENTTVLVTFKDIEVDIEVYTLTLGDNLTASETNLAEIEINTPITITVVVPEGKEVDEFKVNGVVKTLTNNEFELVVTEDTNITVTFKDILVETYSLTLGDNLTASETNLAEIEINTPVIITVTIPEGKEVDEFKVNGVVKTLTNNEFELIVTEDATITVTFKDILVETYSLTLGDNLIASETNLTEIEKNTPVIVTVDVPDGKEINEFFVNGEEVLITDGQYQFLIVEDTYIVVTFNTVQVPPVYYELTLQSDNLTSNFDSQLTSIEEDSLVIINISVPINFIGVESLLVNGLEKVDQVDNLTYEFNINEDTVIEVVFKEEVIVGDYYEIFVIGDADKISFDVVDIESVLEGTSVIATIIIPEGMEIDVLLLDFQPVSMITDVSFTFIVNDNIFIELQLMPIHPKKADLDQLINYYQSLDEYALIGDLYSFYVNNNNNTYYVEELWDDEITPIYYKDNTAMHYYYNDSYYNINIFDVFDLNEFIQSLQTPKYFEYDEDEQYYTFELDHKFIEELKISEQYITFKILNDEFLHYSEREYELVADQKMPNVVKGFVKDLEIQFIDFSFGEYFDVNNIYEYSLYVGFNMNAGLEMIINELLQEQLIYLEITLDPTKIFISYERDGQQVEYNSDNEEYTLFYDGANQTVLNEYGTGNYYILQDYDYFPHDEYYFKHIEHYNIYFDNNYEYVKSFQELLDLNITTNFIEFDYDYEYLEFEQMVTKLKDNEQLINIYANLLFAYEKFNSYYNPITKVLYAEYYVEEPRLTYMAEFYLEDGYYILKSNEFYIKELETEFFDIINEHSYIFGPSFAENLENVTDLLKVFDGGYQVLSEEESFGSYFIDFNDDLSAYSNGGIELTFMKEDSYNFTIAISDLEFDSIIEEYDYTLLIKSNKFDDLNIMYKDIEMFETYHLVAGDGKKGYTEVLLYANVDSVLTYEFNSMITGEQYFNKLESVSKGTHVVYIHYQD